MSTIVLDFENPFDTVGTTIKKKVTTGKEKSQVNITKFFRKNKIFMKFITFKLTCSS